MQFNELSLCPEIQRALEELGYTEPTGIQGIAIPPVLEGKDVTGRSSTGTGKTAAFGLPLVQLAAQNPQRAGALVLCPTRELAVQTTEELRKFARYLKGVSVTAVYGGQPMDGQIRALRTAGIVVGTPGRIQDHLRRKTLRLDNLTTIVLDEADEMLNMGFIDDIRAILELAPPERQTVLFSATMPPAILQLSRDFQHEPVMVEADGGHKTAQTIDQSYYNIPQASKNDALKLLLEYHRPKRALVFCNTKAMVDTLTAALNESGFRSAGLHGDLKQAQRNAVMADFKSGRIKILIATDVAARGIDVEDVEAVFNYDIPQENEYYIHRIGRTGRAGRAGASYTLAANRSQLARVRDIERHTGARIEARAVPSLESIGQNRTEGLAQEIRKAIDEEAGYEWKKFVAQLCAEGVDAADIAAVLCARLQNKNNRLAAVRNVRSIAPGGERRSVSRDARDGFAWLSVNIGSDAKIGPNFIVGAIVEGTGLAASDIGKINIYGDHTEIELRREHAAQVLEEMQNTKIKQRPVQFTKAAGVSHAPQRRGTAPFGRPGFARGKHRNEGTRNRKN